MSGIGNVLAGDPPVAVAVEPPSGPLTCTVRFSGGPGPFTVTNASDDLSHLGYGIIQDELAGGTPPYVETLSILGDASGKIYGANNGLGADTIAYRDFALNEVEYCYLRYDVTDHSGQSASARFPASGTIAIRRAG